MSVIYGCADEFQCGGVCAGERDMMALEQVEGV